MDISISNEYLTASFKQKGAELFSLKSKNGMEYMWEGNPDFWGKHSPVLFPIVGTLRNNTYKHESKTYGLSRHGFARDMDFNIKQKDEKTVCFELVYNNITLNNYPFLFCLEIEYELHENNLTVKYRVKNRGENVMPFSVGAHPAFALPGDFSQYSIVFKNYENLNSYTLTEDLLSDEVKNIPLQGKKMPLDYKLFEDDALVFKKLESKEIALAKNDDQFLRVHFDDFPHLGIWTKPGAPFLCIEPWQGYADAHNASGNIMEKEGMLLLPPGEEILKTFTIEILK